MNRLLLAILALLFASGVSAQTVFINEIHYDNASSDVNEFVEVAGPSGTDLTGYTISLYNGSSTQRNVYDTISLTGSIDDEGSGFGALSFLPPSSIQNGAPDGLSLNDASGAVIQFLCYEGTFEALSGPAAGTTCTDIGVEEGGATAVGESLQLKGSGTTYSDFSWAAPSDDSPGSINAGQTFGAGGGDTVTQPLVFTTPGDPNSAAGWRHLAPPVDGFDIDDLAALNLVQGVPAGASNPQQYPTFGDIVFPSVDASGFVPPVDTDEVIASGQGFFWYLYDRTFTPNPTPGNGTSTSLELTGFELTATGTVPSSDVMFSPPNYFADPAKGVIANRSFLIGNPFGQDLNVGGITANVPLQTTFQTWNPGSGSYVAFEAGTGTENLAVWQGTFAETSDVDTAPTFTYAAASRTGSATAPFYGRPAARPDAISLRLSGRGDNGASITDELAVIRFSDAASTGWDLLDASKLTPPTVAYGLLAPVMDRDGSPWRTAINTLPTESVTVPVDFIATEAGTFFVGADVTIFGGATVRLRDLVTGAEHDFASGDYTFESDATDWTSRFEVVVSFASTAGETGAEAAFRLTAPAPNPARAETRMTLMTSTAQTVRAAIYDALGREVSVLHDGPLAAGASTTLTVDTASLAPGVYVVRAQGETMAQTQRLTVTR